MKLNTDSAIKGNPGEAGFGGVIRDEQGKWRGGYYGKVGISTSLIAELWSIRAGITMTKELGSRNLLWNLIPN